MHILSMIRSFRVILVAIIIIVVIIILGTVVFRRAGSKYTFTGSSQTVIKQLESLNRLETASYTIEKVIDAKTNGNAFQQFLFGDKLLLIAHGQVIAGFDLSKITKDDIRVEGPSLTLTLPSPEILVSKLDSEQTRVYDRRQGLLTKGDTDLESKARAEAENVIRFAACQGGILDEASKNAKNQLISLFKTAGFTSVTIVTPSGTCQ